MVSLCLRLVSSANFVCGTEAKLHHARKQAPTNADGLSVGRWIHEAHPAFDEGAGIAEIQKSGLSWLNNDTGGVTVHPRGRAIFDQSNYLAFTGRDLVEFEL